MPTPTRPTPPLALFLAVAASAPGVGAATLRHLLSGFAAQTDFQTADLHCPETQFALLLQGHPKANAHLSALLTHVPSWPEACNRMEETLKQLGVSLVVLGDSHYPPLLSTIHNPPALLFVKGNPACLTGKTLGMVGTRNISPYGRQVAGHLIAGLVPSGATIVSGLADGMDGECHRQALAHHLPTVAVLGTGIDTIFPKKHTRLAHDIIESGGAIISEYPPGTPGSAHQFPQRNRIIAGLSHGVVVVEGHEKSGSLITAHLALEENRAVFAVPGNLFSPGSAGPHALLSQGAVLTTQASDIVTELKWAETKPHNIAPEAANNLAEALTPEQQHILRCIPYDPTPIDAIALGCQLSVAQLNPQLTLLELMGAIAMAPGACVHRR